MAEQNIGHILVGNERCPRCLAHHPQSFNCELRVTFDGAPEINWKARAEAAEAKLSALAGLAGELEWLSKDADDRTAIPLAEWHVHRQAGRRDAYSDAAQRIRKVLEG